MWRPLPAAAIFGLGALAGAICGAVIATLVTFIGLHATLPGQTGPVSTTRVIASPTPLPPPPASGPRIPTDDPAIALDPELDKQAQSVMAAMKQKQQDDERALGAPGNSAAPQALSTAAPQGALKPALSPAPAAPRSTTTTPPIATKDPAGRMHTTLHFEP